MDASTQKALEDTAIRMEKAEELIKKKLAEWMHTEEDMKNEVTLRFSEDHYTAYALVSYGDMVEIIYLFCYPGSDFASLSCDKQIRLPEEESAKQEVLSAVKETFDAFIHRWR